MTVASSSRRRAVHAALACGVVLGALACRREPKRPVVPASENVRDNRPYRPWHGRDEPLPFPQVEWFWQDLLAIAPAPEPMPADAEAAARIGAAFERVAGIDPVRTEDELPALVADARRDP